MTQQGSSSQSSDWLEITNEYLQKEKEKFYKLPEEGQKGRLNSYFDGCDPDWGRISH